MDHLSKQELIKLALTDDVTGLYNQRKFKLDMNSLESNDYYLVLDLNNFKKVNDTMGHSSGSYILAELGKNIQRLVRSSDICYRYGGDEFVILFKGISFFNAISISKRILEFFKSNPIKVNGNDYYCSLSLGLSKTFDEADRKVYESKKNGKNRLTI